MTDIDKILEEVERLDAAATKGNLVAVRRVSAIILGEAGHARQYRTECILSPLMERRGLDANVIDAVPEGRPLPPPGPDSILLAFCRTAAPALAKEVRRLRAKLVEAAIEIALTDDAPGFRDRAVGRAMCITGIRLKFEDGRFVEDRT